MKTHSTTALVGISIYLCSIINAKACDCATPRNREAAIAHVNKEATNIITGLVLSAKTVKNNLSDGDPIVKAKIKVVETIKGRVNAVIDVESYGGDNGANCGIGKTLILRYRDKKPISLAFDKSSDKRAIKVDLCWSDVIPIKEYPLVIE